MWTIILVCIFNLERRKISTCVSSNGAEWLVSGNQVCDISARTGHAATTVMRDWNQYIEETMRYCTM